MRFASDFVRGMGCISDIVRDVGAGSACLFTNMPRLKSVSLSGFSVFMAMTAESAMADITMIHINFLFRLNFITEYNICITND